MKQLLTVLALMGILLSACSPPASAELVGTWELVSYGDASNPTPAMPGVDTSIEFKVDGTLGGNVGCNSFGGEYKIKGDVIEFGPVMMTEMFCEATAEQEAGVVKVLSGSASFLLEAEVLMMTSSDGSLVVTLKKKQR